MASTKTRGFDVTVTIAEGVPHLHIASPIGFVLDTTALSVKGMENLAVALTNAARMAAREFEGYFLPQTKKATRERVVNANSNGNT